MKILINRLKYMLFIITLPFISNAQSNNKVEWNVFTNGFHESFNHNSKSLIVLGQPLVSISMNENSMFVGGFLSEFLTPNQTTSANDEINSNVTLSYELNQNYPNPFNPSTKIKFTIPKSSTVSLKVYDILGKEVAVLINEEKSAGVYKVEFNAGNLSSGIYLYRLSAGNFTDTKKLILIK